jgi:hypothetical protein
MQSGSERSETQSSTDVFAGVPLGQLVAIAAARAEGFPLDEILDVEGIDAASYHAADMAFKCRLIDSAAREVLCAHYQNELAQAEDRLTRKVSPIDEDIDAWVRFLSAYGSQSAPADWLLAIGLVLPDLSRLSRTWKRRFDDDDALCQRAEKSARDKKPYDVSSLRVSPAKLVPSPLAKPVKMRDLGDATPLPAHVKQSIPRANSNVDHAATSVVPQNLGIAFDFPIKAPAASPLAMTNPIFLLPAEDVLPFVPGPDLPDEVPTLDEQSAALAPSRESLSGTSLAVDIPREFVTPFVAPEPATSVPEKPIELPRVKSAPAELVGTAMAVDIPRGPAIPFVMVSEPATIDAKPISKKLPEVKLPPSELGGTSLAVDIPRGPVTPFSSGKGASVIREKPSVPEKPIVKQAPVELLSTSLAVDIPRGPVTPFVAGKGSSVMGEKTAVSEKPVVKQAPAELSGTSFSLDIPRGPVTPFVAAKESAAKPNVAATPETAPVKEDKPESKLLLSLEQHAALTVEIATYPAQALAILKRYGVTPPQKVDLDQHYRRIVAADSTKQAAWHAAYGAHYAALMRRR